MNPRPQTTCKATRSLPPTRIRASRATKDNGIGRHRALTRRHQWGSSHRRPKTASGLAVFYNWHRFYDPEVGRYVSADPLNLGTVFMEDENLGGAQNYLDRLFNPKLEQPRSYALNAPLTHTDPDGRAVPLIGAGVCALGGCEAIGAAFGAAALTISAAMAAVLCKEAIEKSGCPPCPPDPPLETDTTHPHHPCPGVHWHYRKYNQDSKTCKCYLSKRLFGGCGPAPF